MTIIHLNERQKELLSVIDKKFAFKRPTETEYNSTFRVFSDIEPRRIKPIELYGMTNQKYADWSLPLYKFNNPTVPDIREFPKGYGLYSIYDSGGNHALSNAGIVAWRTIWNLWWHGRKPSYLFERLIDSVGPINISQSL